MSIKVLRLDETSGELVDAPGVIDIQVEDEAWDREMTRLRKYNTNAGLLHLIQGSMLLVYSYTNESAKEM